MTFLRFPLVKVTVGFITGLLLAFYFNPDFGFGIGVVLCGFLLFLLAYFLGSTKKSYSLFLGISVFVLSFGLGVFTWVLHNDTLDKNHYLHKISDQKQLVNVTLDTKLKSNAFNHRYYAKIHSVDNQKSSGVVLVNINKEFYPKEPEIGTNFSIYSKIIPNQIPKNPNQFDYGKYLEKQQVYAQIYTDSTNIRKLKTVKTRNYYTHKIRSKIIENLRKSGFSENELGVLNALILGQKQDVSPEVLQAYQYAGAVHILSVSGLHVAYIYLFVSFVLKLIPNHRRGRFIKLGVLLLSLWGFALLAGMAPAIVRAVTMFSFISVGRFLNRNTNTIYSLVISMLFILLCNPSFLFEVGFQLSYLALFFIVWTKPMMDKFYSPTNKVKKYIWDVATVSLAAQIGVLPLSLYYFNQFPTLFVITNIFVLLPLSFFMVYGVILSVLALFEVTNFYLSKIMEFGIWYINQVSFQVAKFEDFVFKDVSFSLPMLLAGYLFIFSFFLWVRNKKFRNLSLVLSSVLILQTVYILNKLEIKNSNEFIVFNKNKATLLTERKANDIFVYTNDSLSEKDYLTRSYTVGNFSKIVKTDSLQNFYYFNGKKILIVDNSSVYNDNLSPDVVVLVGSPKINLDRFLQNHTPEIIIADASNYKSYIELWKQTCKKHVVPFHSTYEKGFYRIKKE